MLVTEALSVSRLARRHTQCTVGRLQTKQEHSGQTLCTIKSPCAWANSSPELDAAWLSSLPFMQQIWAGLAAQAAFSYCQATGASGACNTSVLRIRSCQQLLSQATGNRMKTPDLTPESFAASPSTVQQLLRFWSASRFSGQRQNAT